MNDYLGVPAIIKLVELNTLQHTPGQSAKIIDKRCI
jgi:hypothetical protein